MLHLHHTKYFIMHNPDDKPSNCFILLMFSSLLNFHAIHEREPWTYHYRWNRVWWWRWQKGGDSLTSTRRINGVWRCPSIDKFSRTSYFGRIFKVPEVCVSYRLLQTVLFLTDSVFRVLFAYFNASMASKLVYKP